MDPDNEKGVETYLENGREASPIDASPEAAEVAAMSPEEYAAFERKLLRKMDLKIIPWITYVSY